MREEVREILRRTGITAVLVTHDRREALNLGDRVAVMEAGRIEQVGTPEAVYYRPATRFVAEFMGPGTLLPGTVEPGGIATELGFFRQAAAQAPGDPVQVLIRSDRPAFLASRVFQNDHVVEARIHEDGKSLLVRTKNADQFHLLLNRIVLEDGITIEGVAPADADVQAVYEYLIGSNGGKA